MIEFLGAEQWACLSDNERQAITASIYQRLIDRTFNDLMIERFS